MHTRIHAWEMQAYMHSCINTYIYAHTHIPTRIPMLPVGLDPSALNYGLKTTMNSDEAVCRGGALQCAMLSSRVKVRFVRTFVCTFVCWWFIRLLVAFFSDSCTHLWTDIHASVYITVHATVYITACIPFHLCSCSCVSLLHIRTTGKDVQYYRQSAVWHCGAFRLCHRGLERRR
jgi:hypothetical protein